MARLIVTEKPSVARDLARVLKITPRGNGVYKGKQVWVTWCLGHLVEQCNPEAYNPEWKRWRASDLPIMPETFKLEPIGRSKKQYQVVRGLLRSKDVEEVINACDAGREGELIFRQVYALAGCTKPVRRLWLSSLTDQAIQQGLRKMRPGSDFDPLAEAARCRSEADWLVGINATRALTLLGRRSAGWNAPLMSVGRVQTPTLAMIVTREDEIEAFVPEPFWHIYAHFEVTDKGRYEGQWFKGQEKRFTKLEEAQAVIRAIEGQTAEVVKVQHKKKHERHPLLFDLTQLQRRANQRYGLSAQATLSAAQSLYEEHKILTYPRTDSNYLTKDMTGSLPKRVRAIAVGPYTPFAQALLEGSLKTSRRIINDAEVGDHHAIVPTGRSVNLDKLSDVERKVFDLVARRFLAVFMPDAVFATTRIETKVAEHLFFTQGRVRLEAGWQAVEPPLKKAATGKSRKGKNGAQVPDLPNVAKGDAADVVKTRLYKGMTQPPKRYNEALLLGAMERAGKELDDAEMRRVMKESGLGTPATRASVIETLLKREYIRRDGKNLVPTGAGRTLIHALDSEVLKSAELTGSWEARLNQIAQKRFEGDAFMRDVRAFLGELIPPILNHTKLELPNVQEDAEVLGDCPLCGAPVSALKKVYSCASGRDCAFVVGKTLAGRSIKPGLVKLLLAGKTSKLLKGFKSKKGKPFQAALRVNRETGRVDMVFDPGGERDAPKGGSNGAARGPRPASKTRPASAPEGRPEPPPIGDRPGSSPDAARASAAPVVCPQCGEGRLVRGRTGWGCGRWREGCRFVVRFEHHGRVLSNAEARQLFVQGHTAPLRGFGASALSSEGAHGRLVLDLGAPGHVRLEAVEVGPS